MGEDEENDKEQEAMKRRERHLRRLGEEENRRYEDALSASSGSLCRDSSPESRGKRRSRSPRRRRSRSPSPRVKSTKR